MPGSFPTRAPRLEEMSSDRHPQDRGGGQREAGPRDGALSKGAQDDTLETTLAVTTVDRRADQCSENSH
jgi:hypothetical protein